MSNVAGFYGIFVRSDRHHVSEYFIRDYLYDVSCAIPLFMKG